MEYRSLLTVQQYNTKKAQHVWQLGLNNFDVLQTSYVESLNVCFVEYQTISWHEYAAKYHYSHQYYQN